MPSLPWRLHTQSKPVRSPSRCTRISPTGPKTSRWNRLSWRPSREPLKRPRQTMSSSRAGDRVPQCPVATAPCPELRGGCCRYGHAGWGHRHQRGHLRGAPGRCVRLGRHTRLMGRPGAELPSQGRTSRRLPSATGVLLAGGCAGAGAETGEPTRFPDWELNRRPKNRMGNCYCSTAGIRSYCKLIILVRFGEIGGENFLWSGWREMVVPDDLDVYCQGITRRAGAETVFLCMTMRN